MFLRLMQSKCFYQNLAVGCWNIEGIYENINSVKINKLTQPFFSEILEKHDIFCLQETHVGKNEILPSFEGYITIPHCREISSNKRFFGGILVFIKLSIQKGIKIDRSFDDDGIVLKLSKSFFGLQNDINLIFSYASPIDSSYTKSKPTNILDKIECQYAPFSTIVMGDLNGRTRIEKDYVDDQTDSHSPINDIDTYSKDIAEKRANMDNHAVDEQGKLILELCKSTGLRILNGRTTGDDKGKLTRYPANTTDNPSTIDYALCDKNIIDSILSFLVLPYNGLSDHCCISVKLGINVETPSFNEVTGENKETPKGTKLIRKTTRVTFDKAKEQEFAQALRDDPNIDILKATTLQPNQNIESVDRIITQVGKIILGAANKTSLVKKCRSPADKRKINTHKWYNKECKANQRALRRQSKKLSDNPFDKKTRCDFIKARNRYKSTCRKAEADARHKLTQKLVNLGQTDPKLFWNTIKAMNDWGKDKHDPTDDIDVEKWTTYFRKLLNDEKNIQIPLGNQPPTFEPTLDSKIKIEELRTALACLKTGKSCSVDDLLGEYVKIFGEMFEDTLLSIINTIFIEKLYPSQWPTNFLKPIFKKGSTLDPDNYRGLAVGSAFAKLFSFILLNRLTEFIDIKKLISPNQIGFMKLMGTSDHIFLLRTIVEKIVKKNKKRLYVVFIDFKKAYDTVNRKLLYEKLKNLGINGTFMRNIEAMYRKTEYCLKMKGGYTPPILSNLGLKQGCPLSPMLFNLYIDDIKYIFDEQCDSVDMQGVKINHFLYADDLVLLSQSKIGLQRCLDKTHQFSKDNLLTISVKKSKSMVFNESGKYIRDTFRLGEETMEAVQEFCYLGVDIKCSGTVKHASNVLNDKGNKALRPLISVIARFKIPTRTAIKLFHTYISPILLYNTENLGFFSDNDIKKYHDKFIFEGTAKSKIDITHRKILKSITGVSKSCPNIALYGDTAEIPISLKSARLTLNYWHRITYNLPENSLVKLALSENISIRSNWIITIEKLLNTFQLTDKIGDHDKFKHATRKSIETEWKEWWKQSLGDPQHSRLKFYREIKEEYKYEQHLDIQHYDKRRLTSKLRCSDHALEIEKGRHKPVHTRKPVQDRKCIFCPHGNVEDEKHFLFYCELYSEIRLRYPITVSGTSTIFTEENLPNLTGYIYEAFKLREDTLAAQINGLGGDQL